MTGRKEKATILVVDPSPISLTALAGVMDSQGYECYCARSPEAADKAIDMSPTDLVLWDVADDAAAALEAIKSLQSRRADDLSNVPFILLAESRWAGLETRLDQIAPARCLFKPLDPNALIDLVEQALWVPHIIRGHHLGQQKADQSGWVSL